MPPNKAIHLTALRAAGDRQAVIPGDFKGTFVAFHPLGTQQVSTADTQASPTVYTNVIKVSGPVHLDRVDHFVYRFDFNLLRVSITVVRDEQYCTSIRKPPLLIE